ncbi:unnamed protein product [Urochloa decumbens]|uniref:F-box domain-containing protein n=1 Tax=Urochloa decumbens TaxID=240449 RepID=A0ABC8YR06_9POAL
MATETRPRATKKKRKRQNAAEPAPCRVTLPDHLVAEVLVRLPARSLARLRCACRSWHAEISSRAFQVRHHALAAAKLAFLRRAPAHMAFLQVRRGNRRPAQWLTSCKDCPGVVGSKPCFGLVLVRTPCEDAGFSVCNPTTGEVLHLPPSHQKRCATGIGFHAPSGEFKVVTVGIDLGTDKLHARVLTVGDAQAQGWRLPSATAAASSAAGDFSDDDVIDTHVQPVFADGCLHWSFFRRKHVDSGPHGVLSFSLADESFRRVAQPAFAADDLVPYEINGPEQQHECQLWLRHARGVRSSGSGGEEAVVACRRSERRLRSSTIWRLQDYEAGRWSLDYRVDLDLAPELVAERERLTAPWLVVPLRYLEGGGGLQGRKRKLLLVTTAREAHVYDPDSGTLRTVASVAGGGDGNSEDNSLRLVLYQESLVRLADMKRDKGEIEFLKLESNFKRLSKSFLITSFRYFD